MWVLIWVKVVFVVLFMGVFLVFGSRGSMCVRGGKVYLVGSVSVWFVFSRFRLRIYLFFFFNI